MNDPELAALEAELAATEPATAPARPVDLEDVSIGAPTHPGRARLWRLAVAKHEARAGAPPATRADWNRVVDEYHALGRKLSGTLAEVVREFCRDAPGGD